MRKFLIIIALFASATAFGQSLTARYAARLTEPRTYNAYRIRGKIKVDGKLKETDWKRAAESDLFADISGPGFPAPTKDTRVKMLWDDEYLYIGATLEEDNIVGNLKQRDTIIWKQNDFEIFIDPDGDGINYFEIETNVRGTLLDLIMDKPYRSGGNFYSPWDCPGLKLAVYCKGTVGKSSDKDQYWTVEAAIPRASLMWGFTDAASLPYWRVNFSRVEWLKKDKEENWVWSPTGEINMHMPKRWGFVHFVDAPVGAVDGVAVFSALDRRAGHHDAAGVAALVRRGHLQLNGAGRQQRAPLEHEPNAHGLAALGAWCVRAEIRPACTVTFADPTIARISRMQSVPCR